MTSPNFAVPANACDCHIHIYEEGFALAPTATFKPPSAPVSEYRKVQAALGLQRVVVVQPTAYGFDNTCTMEAVVALGPGARGIAVVAPDVGDTELQRLTDGGVRGLRFFMLPGAVFSWAQLAPMAGRVAAHGWHVQLQLDGRLLPEYEAALRKLPCDLVIDHNGKFLEPVDIEHPAFQSLLRLLDTGRCWVKLSAPYETSKSGPPDYADVSRLARELVARHPERCVWASNWPHPNRHPAPSNAAMLDLLGDWAPDEAVRNRILVGNAAQLYGFD